MSRVYGMLCLVQRGLEISLGCGILEEQLLESSREPMPGGVVQSVILTQRRFVSRMTMTRLGLVQATQDSRWMFSR